MGKQTKSQASQSFGKGDVTPMQTAFIVDRYLADNNFSDARSAFRTEAASLIAKSPVQEAPKSLLSLGDMLNEYILLKEQKVMVDQERVRLEQEKIRVQTLLHGMQDVMNAYNVNAPGPLIQNSAVRSMVVPQSGLRSSAGCSMYTSSPTVVPFPMGTNIINQHTNMSSSVKNLTRKRVGSIVGLEPSSANKKSRSRLPLNVKKPANQAITHEAAQPDNAATTNVTAQSSMIKLSPHNHVRSFTIGQGSSVAKSLFNQPSLPPPTNSTGPNTPPRAIFTDNDRSVSSMGVSSSAYCSNSITSQVTPTNCTVITSERLTVSPCKHVSYTMERNQCISSSSPIKTTYNRLTKRETVKGRLDFDISDVAPSVDKPIVEELCSSESDKEGDPFDIDLPNLDAFGANFSFSELLIDLDLECEGLGCPPVLGASTDCFSGSSPESGDGNLGDDPLISDFSSTMTEAISGIDTNIETNIQGSDAPTAMKTISNNIILSPAKTNRSSPEQ
ncbi:uncharacterized protein LOC126678160 [Mercurialis annua]|uniref:uncharacterized protein LOC126678160 n=1 Tax=Mercurialis annua TaxID=3986 RepID=UPI00215F8E42|nr:uncharacterized protein LOC126678160 [Mercurialis annua]